MNRSGVDSGARPATPLEIEAKLHASQRLFQALVADPAIGDWQVVEQRAVQLRDTYWDTPDHRLARAGCTLRIREQQVAAAPGATATPPRPTGAPHTPPASGPGDQNEACGPPNSPPSGAPWVELTLKGPVATHAVPTILPGQARRQRHPPADARDLSRARDARASLRAVPPLSRTRTELTVAVPAGSGLPDWARLPAVQPLLASLQEVIGKELNVTDALRPDVVLLNPRRELVLRRDGEEVVLSLDEVRLEGRPYCRRYVELELKHGARSALDELVHEFTQRFRLRPARYGKVDAARRWLAARE